MNALMTEHDLRQAVAEEGFDVHFQPIIDLSDGRVAGLEALARWPHPTHGMISPRVFIPLAEEVGLDIEISLWVLREACRQVRAWQEQSGLASLWLSVNFSSRLFHGAAVDKVAAILGDIGFEPHHLKLEIVEEVLEDESAIVNLQKLRDLGVHIHIDDFGHDATSPAYLRKLPADAIKIDPSVVQGIIESPETAELARTMIEMAETLGMPVIAEAVETEAQLDRLTAFRCSHAQGYYFSKPLDRQGVKEYLKQPQGQGQGIPEQFVHQG